MYLIQGYFFQNQEWLGLACKPLDGVVPVIERGLLQTMYAGFIYEDSRLGLVGKMMDRYGFSVLSQIYLGNSRFSFVKRYDRRDDSIQYTFSVREGKIWSGKYEGSLVGEGVTQCLFDEAPDSFGDLRHLMSVLGVNSAHEWKEA